MKQSRLQELEKVQEAIEIACVAHDGQFRKGTRIPYIIHPLKVQALLNAFNQSNNAQVAGLLHDVVEDTPITTNEITKIFGEDIGFLVYALTLDKSLGWKNARMKFFENYANPNNFKGEEEAWCNLWSVKAADIIVNLEDIIMEYTKKGDEVFKKFNASKEDEAWYYAEVLYWAAAITKDNDMAQEMINYGFYVYKRLFGNKTLSKYKPDLDSYIKKWRA